MVFHEAMAKPNWKNPSEIEKTHATTKHLLIDLGSIAAMLSLGLLIVSADYS